MPEGLSLEVGLDFSCVARDRGRFRETETGSVRWRKNPQAMPFVLGLSGKVGRESGQSSPLGVSKETGWP